MEQKKLLEERRRYQREYMRKRRQLSRSHENELARKRRATNPEKYKQKERDLYAKSKRRIIELRRSNPKLIAARTAVNNSVRDKKLLREPCAICGEVKSEAHHTDYTKPLEVTWLCRLHHAAWHRLFIPEYGEKER